MPQGLRKPRLPRFGEPRAPAARPVHVRAASVHGIPIELRLDPAAEVLSHPASFSHASATRGRGTFASFVRALHAPSDGLTVEVEAFCATPGVESPPAPPTPLLLPKVPTPHPLPDRAGEPVQPTRQAAPLPAPIGAPVQTPAPSNAAPPPSLEELAALAEIRDLAGTPPQAPRPDEPPFPPPRAKSPAQAPAPVEAQSVGHAHDVFDRMAPPMAMTFDVGNVSLQRRFSDLDARLDRERAPSRRARGTVARAASIDDVSLANDLAGMRWSMGAHAGHGHADTASPPLDVTTPPTMEKQVAPMPSLLAPIPSPSPATTAVKLIDARTLMAGDVIIAVEVPAPTALGERDAAPSRTLLSLGGAQVAESFGSGVVVRSVADATATAVSAIAFRPAPGAAVLPGDTSVPPTLLAYLGHLKAPTTR